MSLETLSVVVVDNKPVKESQEGQELLSADEK